MKRVVVMPFFNEVEVAEIKFAEMDAWADLFVVSEGDRTYAGEKRELIFPQNWDRWDQWRDKIVFVPVTDMPDNDTKELPPNLFQPSNSGHWLRENHLRNSVIGIAEDDIVCLTDCDEIVKPEVLSAYEDDVSRLGVVRFNLPQHVYYLNWRWPNEPQAVARLCRGGAILRKNVNYMVRHMQPPAIDEMRCGWHFAYMGGTERIAYKIEQAAHHELARPEFLDRNSIEFAMKHGTDIFHRDIKCQWVGLSKLPKYVQDNSEKFSSLLIESPVAA